MDDKKKKGFDMSKVKGSKLIAPIALVVIIVAIALCIAFLPNAITGGSSSTDASKRSSSSSQTVKDSKKKASKEFPKDADKNATDYLMSLIKKTNDKVPSDFLTKSEDALNKFGNGDTSAFPEEVKSRFIFSNDINDGDNSVSKNTFVASAYMGVIMTAQAYRMVTATSTVSVNYNLVYVNQAENRVYIPAEAVTGYPVAVSFTLVWTDDGWKIDGDELGVNMSANFRKSAAELQAQQRSSSSSDSSSSNESK